MIVSQRTFSTPGIIGILPILTWVFLQDLNGNNNLREIARLSREFRYKDLKKATNNFRHKLGSGRSGSVFKGILDDGTPVAVKIVVHVEYGKRIFEAEISTIASVQHVNLVRLCGYCSPMKESWGAFFIVYDLFPKGSLDNWIFPQRGSQIGQCFIMEIEILHLDLKPENILLDDKFRAVLSDFGLSRLMKEDEGSVIRTIIRGTAGYMTPECHLGDHGISEKCDIFSYGKVLMDLFFGRYVCLDDKGNDISINGGNSILEQQTFHSFILEKLTQSKILDLIDHRLMNDGKVNEKEASCLVHAALCCLEEDPKKWPGDMRQVINMLQVWKLDGIGSFEQHFESQNEDSNLGMIAGFAREFLYEELETATNDFSDRLGDGWSGSVFRGKLDDGTLVAVKTVERKGYGEQEFKAEISAIASIQHVHLMRLRGYSSRITETCGVFSMVYDLFPNRSLAVWIFDGAEDLCLSWTLRYKVAIDVVKALAYLHHDCHPRILHLDINLDHILLDGSFRAVLYDFGFFELMMKDKKRMCTSFSGTKAYMGPEWFTGDGVLEKCDIFSFGKVLLDLFFGEPYACLDQNGKDIHLRSGNSQLEQRAFHAFM
ncbi:hypothetical protein GIB67_030838 [Kingdonia uniflora]|uniref:Protein kinase domain-containing protein n=1 Tax=Kingdonia uniflora TaxID=39325 RepID=A0A7J7L3E2_9MAGN|nr:hypothetical protein GIB67_030838 [Kingdonia uniflora]